MINNELKCIISMNGDPGVLNISAFVAKNGAIPVSPQIPMNNKIAPNITVFKQDSTPISLHDVKAKYTILLIWAPDCGHCKQSMPSIKKFYEEYKSKGVEIFAVCSKTGPDEKTCWEGVSQLGMGGWINTSDPQHKSKFRLVYDVKTTPQVYFLDENKKILTKKIAGEQFKEVMDKINAIQKSGTN